MSGLIDSVWLHWPETKALAAAIAPLRFVGGCVRDGLLERTVSDVDAATPLAPQEVMASLQAAGHKAIPTGIKHGTVTAVVGARHFEITTLRRDVETDGRHAVVAFTDDWREDASRRDFTMNALYCDAQGLVTDYFGGEEDARAGRVRFIGDARTRIEEDALRILRFFRFYAYYGQSAIDRQGLAACGEMAEKVAMLSGERIAMEMLKLLAAKSAAQVVGLMQRHGIWPYLVPATVKVEALDLLPGLLRKAHRKSDGLLSLALLLRGTTGDKDKLVQNVASRWKLSGAQAKRLHALCAAAQKLYSFPPCGGRLGRGVANGKNEPMPTPLLNPPPQGGRISQEPMLGHPIRPANTSDRDEAQWKRAIRACGKALFIDHMLLAMAEGAEEASGLAAIALARSWEPPVFPITGDDLIARGVKPGKELGGTLKILERQWEDSGYSESKEGLLSSKH